MSSNFLQTLSTDIGQLLQDSDECNIIIEVGEDSNIKEFYAHSIILRARSPYFRRALSHEWTKIEDGRRKFKKPNIKPEVFELILKFIYCGDINLDGQDVSRILELLVATDELLLSELSDHVQDYILHCQSEWLKQNVVSLWTKIHHYDACAKLKNHCLRLICRKPQFLFASEDFLSMPESLLLPFLRIDGLRMEEIEIWDHVLRWGLAQHPEVRDKDMSKWSTDEYDGLERTLKNCMPLIDFAHVSSNDFYDKVWPFQEMLPKTLLEDIVRYHLKTSSLPQPVKLASRLQFDSALIRTSHVALLASWIDRLGDKRYLYDEIPYRFQLLLRGTRDGFSSSVFHELCDEKPKTVVVIKIRGTDEIIGGYSPLIWKPMDGYCNTEDSFLFSFGDRGNVEDAILSRVSLSRSYYAIRWNGRDYGPCFGDKDLWMRNKFNEEHGCSCRRDDYLESITDCATFSVEEYEVFRVVKKTSLM